MSDFEDYLKETADLMASIPTDVVWEAHVEARGSSYRKSIKAGDWELVPIRDVTYKVKNNLRDPSKTRYQWFIDVYKGGRYLGAKKVAAHTGEGHRDKENAAGEKLIATVKKLTGMQNFTSSMVSNR